MSTDAGTASAIALRNRGAIRAAAGLVLLCAVVSTVSPVFLGLENASNLLSQLAPLLLVALGETLVVITAGLDISIGAVISLTTAIVSLPALGAAGVPVALLVAAAFGLVNGAGVVRLGIHPIVMTLATMTIAHGMALLLRPTPGGDVGPLLVGLVNGNLVGVPAAAFWIVAGMAIFVYLLRHSRFGLHLYAVGGSFDSARLGGVASARVTVTAYVLCSSMAGVAGIYLSGRIASGDPLIGMPYMVDAIIAMALGGTFLTGGIGSAWGTLAGVAIIGVMANGMNLANVSPFYQDIVKGVLLVLAALMYRRREIGL